MDRASEFALGACFGCANVFDFNPDTVPSILIDPETTLPPDLTNDVEAATARAQRQPLCPSCVAKVNAKREAAGLPPIRALTTGS